jgi:hypothetical protein
VRKQASNLHVPPETMSVEGRAVRRSRDQTFPTSRPSVIIYLFVYFSLFSTFRRSAGPARFGGLTRIL